MSKRVKSEQSEVCEVSESVSHFFCFVNFICLLICLANHVDGLGIAEAGLLSRLNQILHRSGVGY